MIAIKPRLKRTGIALYFLIISLFLTATYLTSAVTTMVSQSFQADNKTIVIIDAGHGGIDGGATSCTGRLESSYNLQIALRLNDLMHLLGIRTRMVRTTDTSVYTAGDTIAAQKMSDLKERVRITGEKERSILVSIHQNTFSDPQYSGAQVFYSGTSRSRELAEALQTSLIASLNSGSKRKCKKADGIYLMEHISCPGVLVECGFLSNPEEEARLGSEDYQKKLCCVIASSVSLFLQTEYPNT